MKRQTRIVAWFDEVTKDDIPLVGGKGANLGEMVHAQIPVPPGFIVTADAYFRFLEASGVIPEVRRLLAKLDVNKTRQLQDVASSIKELISKAPIPEDLSTEIKKAYRKLGEGLVAVRSSATAEDLPEASFAGQQSTFLNIEGEDKVIAAVQNCWASLFEARAIFYREQNKFSHFRVGIAVPVQRMVQSQASGVLFTVEPVSSDKTKIIIEAIYGLGEAIVSGDVTPDLYMLDKETIKIIDKKIRKQEWQLVKNSKTEPNALHTNIKMPVPDSMQEMQKLADQDIIALAKIGKMIENLYKSPQDIEWAKQDAHLYIVQTRPVTTIKEKETTETHIKIEAKPLFTGIAASPGTAAGTVRIILEASQIDKVETGDVLVAEMTTPDFVPAMKRAVAIVTDRGGRTAHAAIVSRELGIPCVVGTEVATKVLKDKQEITVDGSTGKVYQGLAAIEKKTAPAVISGERIKTHTRLYVNLANPEMAEEVAKRDVDGVGLLRAEFMITDAIKYHPRYMLHEGRGAQFVAGLTRGINTFARAFHPRPVVYRTTDFKTNEYRNLQGGDRYEEPEENPMLGYRGCSRYTRETEVLRLEV
ncbi:MAG: phosphoenolpyruvate synthase, partial [Chloroflexi bacterium]|nr:phosphoenolpyruvate synthase [Chloroflexota bacterium]